MTAGATVAAAVLSAAVSPSLLGQTAPAATPASEPATDDIVVLSPFVVSANDSNSGYSVKDTLAGTRVRTELKDVASSLVVVSKQFMNDVGATDNQTLLQYTGSTEVGGVGGNFLGNYPLTADSYGESRNLLRPNSNTRIRGLDAADNTRDYFLTDIPWDGYIVDRVDIQRGPNSILFGVGSPAGIVNSSLNAASFKTGYKVENRIDNWGSIRTSLDANQVLLSDQLAIRVAALDDRKKFEQKPAKDNAKRVYVAIRFDPKLIDGGSTSFRVNYENGKVDANRPRTLTPLDCITPWFTGMNKQSFDPSTDSPLSTVNAANPYVNGVAVGRQYWPGVVGYYSDTTGSTPTTYMAAMQSATKNGINSSGVDDDSIGGLLWTRFFTVADYKQYMSNMGTSGSGYYSTKGLTDDSIYDFYSNLIDGDNKREWQRWNAANFSFDQTLLDGRLGLQAVYDLQRYKDGYEGIFEGGGAYALGVDINTHLINGDVNPNYGKIYVSGSLDNGGHETKIDRDSMRLTAFGELRASDFFGKKTLATRILGRHVITGLLSSELKRSLDRTYALAYADADYAKLIGEDYTVNGHIGSYNYMAYLSGSLASGTTASGANASRVKVDIDAPATADALVFIGNWNRSTVPGTLNYVDPAAEYIYTDRDSVVVTSTQSENPANYVGWTNYSVDYKRVSAGDKESLITGAYKKRNKVTSQGVTWQGYMLDECFVPVFGWRKDKVVMKRGDDATDSMGYVDSQFDYDAANYRSTTGESKSWGGVLHMPKFLSEKLPGKTRLSVFYNRSSNFKADEPRQNVFGDDIDNPSASTKEYGFAISTLEDRLTLKVNWYRTTMKNATLPYGTGFSYQQWAYPAWLIGHAALYADVSYRQHWTGGWDMSETPEEQATLSAALEALKSIPLNQSFFTYYGNELAKINMEAVRSGDYMNFGPLVNSNRVDYQKAGSVSPVASADTLSKGVEYELTAQLLKNWNLTLNVTKVKAVYSAVSPELISYMDAMNAFMNGPAGELGMWGGTGESDKFKNKWNNDVVPSWNTLMAYLGNSSPEIAPWRANLVTTYSFDTGAIKGLYVGGGYRWEDKKILGYGLKNGVVSAELPLYGKSEDHYDFWVGYGRKITDKVDWRIQLNLRNVGEKHHLVAASYEPDGTWALARICDGMSWQLSNTFSF